MNKILAALLAVLIAVPAHSQEISFTPQQVALLQVAQDYLAKVKTVKANFLQVNPGSTGISSGEIYISKPGRLKMVFTTPFNIEYYVDGDKVIQYDKDLDEVTRGDAPDNPLKVLLDDDVTLSRNGIMDVTNVVEDARVFYIFMLNRTSEIRDISGMILKFKKNPIELIGIQRVDAEGNKTETSLTAVTTNEPIADSVFKIKRAKSQYPSQQD